MIAISFIIGAFLLTFLTLPKIIAVVEYKNLLDEPNKRSSHKKVTPTLGGISFYFTLMFSFFFLKYFDVNHIVYNILPGLTILFVFGLKDDLVVLSPTSKLIGQLVAVSFVLLNPAFQIESLNGFLGIYHIPQYVAIGVSAMLMVLIINAYNLIDGIDGLAASIGIIISIVNAIIFYYLQLHFYFYLALIIIATLSAFLPYNLSKKDNKIFMGDTGSLIIGFVISIFTIKLLTLNEQISASDFPMVIENLPLVALVILIVPLFDTLRVFTIRIVNKKSPFSADRNHMHHILIDLGLTHIKASLILILFNIVFVMLFIYLSSTSQQMYLIIFLILIGLILAFIFYRLDFSFSNLRKKVLMRRKTERFRNKMKRVEKKGKANKKKF